jgi:hypothetical protein
LGFILDCVGKIVKKFMGVRTPEQKFKREEGLPPWPRAKKMESQPCCDLKITFDEGKNYSQGLESLSQGLPAYLKNAAQALCIIWD